jgi:fructosamine-3-kinase
VLDAATLRKALEPALGSPVHLDGSESVAGGDMHRALRVRANGRDWFVKWNRADVLPQFLAEAEALDALARAAGPRVPGVLAAGNDARHAWLVLEHLPLRPTGDAEALGAALARMHRTTAERHGWSADNFIGTTPQRNGPIDAWDEFWWRRRLRPQLDLAAEKGLAGPLANVHEKLEAACGRLLAHDPRPALLHGDLWGGNHAYLDDGRPVIFDPASSFGDRETDLAMMRLFGGFDPRVFSAYDAASPLPEGHEHRVAIYQLYHVLNHLNLFGSGWLGRAETLLNRIFRSAGST